MLVSFITLFVSNINLKGIDDSFAIILALLHPEWEVIAITCVFGNVQIESMLHFSLNPILP